MIMKSENVDDNFELDEEIICATIQKVDKEVECRKKKEKEEEENKMQFFNLKIQYKKIHSDLIFDIGSQVKLIVDHLVNKLDLNTYNHPHPYPLGWVYKDASLQVTKQCKLNVVVSGNFINEVVFNVVPLDLCCIVYGNPYILERDVLYFRRLKYFKLMKNDKTYEIDKHMQLVKIS